MTDGVKLGGAGAQFANADFPKRPDRGETFIKRQRLVLLSCDAPEPVGVDRTLFLQSAASQAVSRRCQRGHVSERLDRNRRTSPELPEWTPAEGSAEDFPSVSRFGFLLIILLHFFQWVNWNLSHGGSLFHSTFYLIRVQPCQTQTHTQLNKLAGRLGICLIAAGCDPSYV